MNSYLILDIASLINNDLDLLTLANIYIPNWPAKRFYQAPSYLPHAREFKYEWDRIYIWGTMLHTLKEMTPPPDDPYFRNLRHKIENDFILNEYDFLYCALAHCRERARYVQRYRKSHSNLPKSYYIKYLEVILKICYDIDNDQNSDHEIPEPDADRTFETLFCCLLGIRYHSKNIYDPQIIYILKRVLSKVDPQYFNTQNKLLGYACAKDATPFVKLIIEAGATTCPNPLCIRSIAEHSRPLEDEEEEEAS